MAEAGAVGEHITGVVAHAEDDGFIAIHRGDQRLFVRVGIHRRAVVNGILIDRAAVRVIDQLDDAELLILRIEVEDELLHAAVTDDSGGIL